MRGYQVTRSPMIIQMVAFWGVALPVGWILGLAPAGSRGRRRADGGDGLLDRAGAGPDVAAVLLAWSLDKLWRNCGCARRGAAVA
jgi:MATE family multidrug resistance protein